MKKISMFAALLALIFVLAACGSPAAVATATPASTTPPPAATIVATSVAPTATPAPGLPSTPPVPPTPSSANTCKTVTATYAAPTLTVVGLDASGATLWTNTFTIADETESQPYSEALVQGGIVYMQADYAIVALDGATGKTIWKSALTGGLCTPILKGGIVYTCSYAAEPLIALSAADGSTLFKATVDDATFTGPISLVFQGDTIVVSFDTAGPDQSTGSAVFDLSGKLISKKVD